MKKYLYITLFLVFTFSCTDTNEREIKEFTVSIKNVSQSNVLIKGYNFENHLIFENQIITNMSSDNCVYSSEVFLGFSCDYDSLVFKFDNDKGYICSLRSNDNSNICFNSKNPYIFNDEDFISLGNNTFEFIVTQEDYENAYDLPD